MSSLEVIDAEIIEYNEVDSKAAQAHRGLMGELSTLSRGMYDRAIRDFQEYASQQGRSAFGDSLPVLFSDFLRHLKDTGLAGSTVQAKRVQLRRYFEWCARVGLISQIELHEANSVKTPKIQGAKAGTWLSESQMQALLNAPDTTTLAGRRDKAVLALLMGCGMRRSEVVALTWGHLVQYEDRWVIKNMSRKHGRVQAYIPVAPWVKKVIDLYSVGGKPNQKVITSVDQHGNVGEGISVIGIYHIVKKYASLLGFNDLAPHDLRRSFARLSKEKGLELSQLQLMLGHNSVSTTEKYVNEAMSIKNIADTFELEVE